MEKKTVMELLVGLGFLALLAWLLVYFFQRDN